MSFGQQKHFNLTWDGPRVLENRLNKITVPYFDNEYTDFTDGVLEFGFHWLDNQRVDPASLKVFNVQYETISVSDLYDLKLTSLKEDLGATLKTSKAREQLHTFLRFNPIVYNNGVIRRVKSIDVSYSYLNNGYKVDDVPAISNSILATGNWYKFYVEESGVFRINRQFLNSLGVNLSEVDPRTIKIYGYGGDMLPLLNEDNEYYDLPEIPLQVRGEEDGNFDSSDYILFYATGPNEWNEDSQTNNNLYNDIIYYYLTYGGVNGKRVQVGVEPNLGASQSITMYDDYQFHELDEYNIVNLGRRWFGEIFNGDAEESFEFDLENLVTTEPVRIGVKAAATSSVVTSMDASVNGQSLFTLSFNPIDEEGGLYATEDSNVPGVPFTRGLRYGEVNVSSEEVTVTLNYNSNQVPSSLGFLDYITVESKRMLSGRGEQFSFTYNDAATMTGVGEYVISNASNVRQVWDVTDMYNVSAYQNVGQDDVYSFKVNLGEAREYVVVDALGYKSPSINSSDRNVTNQNLKGTIFTDEVGNFAGVDYIIFTPDIFRSQAERLANFHRSYSGLNTKVVTFQEVYDEFSTGNQDIVAIRNFIKYVYDNAPSAAEQLQYICMFGDGSYDYKNITSGNTNFAPLFHSYYSFSLTTSISTDDFYGMMDADDGAMDTNDLLDIAVGRIVVDDVQQASEVVDKIINYVDNESYGRWRNNILLVSDDVDLSWEYQIEELQDALGDEIEVNKPFFNIEKVHTDSYVQQTTSGGERYPDAKSDLLDKIKLGALVISYFGHGGEEGLSSERIFQTADVQQLDNEYRYPLFITVTCDFSRFDNPSQDTAGEYLYWNANGGAISLITTTREIYAINGGIYNDIIAEYLYGYGTTDYVSIGEALRLAKNDPMFGTSIQKRVVSYIGDPALKLAIPEPQVNLTHVNGVPVAQADEVLEALSTVTLRGNVTNENGVLLSSYSGNVFVTVYDKDIERQTLGNDGVVVDTASGEVYKMDFKVLGEVLFRGKATVVNGEFDFEFVVPRDALIPVDNGRISFYTIDDEYTGDKTGYNTDILIGGLNENAPEDNDGPEITLYMNDQNFLYGGMTNQSPILLAYLTDENGINTSSGIGHDIVAILDGDESNPYVLNDYYETELDVYTDGVVTFPFSDLEPGLHTLSFKAWDTYNNSSIAEIQFLVVDDEEMKLEKVLNYPNPFVSYTEFWFQHNKPYEPLDVQVQVFTVSGKLVWTHNQTITTEGYLSRDITWDGRDDFGNKIGKGVYVYKITVKSTLSNKVAEKFEKLVIL
ncbi:peptidase C25 [Neptunitalea sp. Y10]|uniref:Peptidase C25 n=1 Tax=Neptunitalea lumnitzerae TaxID=2965509 RepID=A0ABQ5MHB6_9FLAO|nr:peptidase C25 [Neptunitalea sp. Y10]